MGAGCSPRRCSSGFRCFPVEEEGRLTDPTLRENFIERVFAYRRLKALFPTRWTHGALVAFHTAHKMALLAHSTTAYQALGRLVARRREIATRRAARRLPVAIHADAVDSGDDQAPHERADAHGGSPQDAPRSRIEDASCCSDRRISPWPRAARRATHAHSPLRAPASRRVPRRARRISNRIRAS